MRLEKTFRFEAAHDLPNHKGKCNRLHGHSWILHVFVEGSINPKSGMVIDYGDIKEAVQPLVNDYLDHWYLNAWIVNPTSENVLIWIAYWLRSSHFEWSALSLEETCTSSAYLTRKEYDDAQDAENGQEGRQEETQEAEEVTNNDIPF